MVSYRLCFAEQPCRIGRTLTSLPVTFRMLEPLITFTAPLHNRNISTDFGSLDTTPKCKHRSDKSPHLSCVSHRNHHLHAITHVTLATTISNTRTPSAGHSQKSKIPPKFPLHLFLSNFTVFGRSCGSALHASAISLSNIRS